MLWVVGGKVSYPMEKGFGGWWNVFQFKSNDENGVSQPVWVLNVGNDKKSGKMQFYFNSKHNQPNSISQPTPVHIPVGRWFHLVLEASKVKTVLTENAIWGIGNYTDHITGGPNPGSATIYFDDATLSTKPTHKYVNEVLKAQR